MLAHIAVGWQAGLCGPWLYRGLMADSKPKLIVRPALGADVKAIAALSTKVYGKADAFSPAQIRGLINNFPEGQIVAEYEGRIVGHCATLIVTSRQAFGPHSWNEITGDGYGRVPPDNGDILYGMEVCVDPDFRRLRIGERFYRKRRELCDEFELKGIVIVGRMPGFYSLYVGGDFAGTRLNTPVADKVAMNAIGETLDPLFELFSATRNAGEGFGDFCHRIGVPALQQALAERRRGAA